MVNDEMPETVWCFEPRKELENFSTGEYMTIGDEESHAYTRSDLYEKALEEVGRLRAMVEGMKKDLAYIRVTETDVRLALYELPDACWRMSPTKADIHAVAHRLTARINARVFLSTTSTGGVTDD